MRLSNTAYKDSSEYFKTITLHARSLRKFFDILETSKSHHYLSRKTFVRDIESC